MVADRWLNFMYNRNSIKLSGKIIVLYITMEHQDKYIFDII